MKHKRFSSLLKRGGMIFLTFVWMLSACVGWTFIPGRPAAGPVQAATAENQFTVSVSDGAVTITGYTGSSSSVTIPSTIGGKPVKAIGKKCFYQNKTLTSLTIPTGITSIGSQALYGCSKLSSVFIPDSVTVIGTYAFYGCSSLSSLVIPEGVHTLKNSCFGDCTSLKKLVIPSTVSEMEGFAFAGCSGLTDVTLSDCVTVMNYYVFYGCRNLKSVLLPSAVTSVEEGAFMECTSLKEIIVPKSVDYIGYDAFSGCSSLTICGETGSYAQRFASENHVAFREPSFQNTSFLSRQQIPKRTMVTVQGRSVYGSGAVRYAFYYKKSTSSSWTSIGTKYGSAAEVSFVPTMSAVYQVMVKAKDESGKVLTKILTLNAYDPFEADLVNRSAITKTSAKKGEAIGLTGKASGGAGEYTYAFYYKKPTSKTFTAISTPYSGKTKVYFKPAYAVTYTVRICVKDSEGTIAVKEYQLQVGA